ncbi:MAG: response regulator transcription factor [Chloroflexi bacterium]|nr:response regulator transcription factor [Chloroflexota bacterium]
MRILLSDDHALFRDGLASLLKAWGMEVVGEASDGLEAVDKARLLQPDLILMDINMPRCDGLGATRRIKAEMPQIKVVMLTVSDDSDDLFDAIKSGAQGYMLKDLSSEQFMEMLQRVARGEVALSPTLATRIWNEFSREKAKRRTEAGEESLTAREMDVLHLTAEGKSNKEMASILHISENTATYHMKNILAKLHLKNRAQVVAYAYREGILKDGPAS